MPIRPENKHRYPNDWPEIRERIRARAGNKCENCHVRNHAIGIRLKDGSFRPLTAAERNMVHARIKNQRSSMRESLKFHGYFRIVCTVAHLDHTPENCQEENLRFWCQRCHNQYDRKHRIETNRCRKLNGQLSLGI